MYLLLTKRKSYCGLFIVSAVDLVLFFKRDVSGVGGP